MNRGTTFEQSQGARAASPRWSEAPAELFHHGTTAPGFRASSLLAFTLIELLVVISIIGVLAALVIPLSGVATAKMRIARTRGELNQYATAIESYKLESGYYPPDSFTALRSSNPPEYRNVLNDPVRYKLWAATNVLFYELTGAIFTNGVFQPLAGGDPVSPAIIQNTFNVSGIQNSARNKHDLSYKGFSIRPVQYATLNSSGVQVLNVPVPGPYEMIGRNNKRINPWFYDASTTNRHNKGSFDLWAEIMIGNKTTNIIANWRN